MFKSASGRLSSRKNQRAQMGGRRGIELDYCLSVVLQGAAHKTRYTFMARWRSFITFHKHFNHNKPFCFCAARLRAILNNKKNLIFN